MKGNTISQTRQNRILEMLTAQGTVQVVELADYFHVSPITIRRDLDLLSEEGLLVRVHGGARCAPETNNELRFVEKGITHVREKELIAECAAGLIQDGQTIFMNAGSTTVRVLQHLQGKSVRIITNNAAAAAVERDAGIELILVGGEHRIESQSLVGEIAFQSIRGVFADCTLIGVNGVDVAHGLTSSVYQETGINRLMIEHTRENVVVLADHTKVGHVSNFSTASFAQVTTIVTDDQTPQMYIDSFKDAGKSVLVARL